METVILKLRCPDKKGIVASVTSFVSNNNGNIINLDQYTEAKKNIFFMRLEWQKDEFKISEDEVESQLGEYLRKNGINDGWELYFSKNRPKMAIFVSKYEHCLFDLLIRYKSGELKCEIPLIISNHDELKDVAGFFGIKFVCIKVDGDNKEKAEKKELELLKEHNIDFIVFARYMQIVTKFLIDEYKEKIINIHHSFLPAFKGGNPYRQAHERGVKIIGATSHFVTAELDQGPIIKQDVIMVSHKDRIKDLVIKGKDIERRVLADAVKLFIQNRIFVCQNKTIVL